VNDAAGVTVDRPLWSKADTARLRTLAGAGAVVLGVSWFGASGQSDAGRQLVYVSLAVCGMFVGMAGVGGWLLGGRRTVRAQTRLLLGDAPAAPSTSAGPASGSFVAVPDAQWFHRADCLLVKDRTLAVSPRSDHEAAGRKACPACVRLPAEVTA
jgi:hypothetical protein